MLHSMFKDGAGKAMCSSSDFDFEVLTSAELAQRLKVKESWVVDQSKRSRTSDPLPIFRLGNHRWATPKVASMFAKPKNGQRVRSA